MRATILFAAIGLASGAVAISLFDRAHVLTSDRGPDLLVDGAVLLAGLTLALAICNRTGMLRVRASSGRYLLAALMVFVLPMVGIVTGYYGFLGLMLYLDSLLPRWSVAAWAGALTGLTFGAICAAVCLFVAVFSVGGEWDKRSLVSLGIAAVVTGTAPAALAPLPSGYAGRYWVGLLHIVGGTLFAAAAGYCLSRTYTLTQRSHDRSAP
jgi:hypothetical protein